MKLSTELLEQQALEAFKTLAAHRASDHLRFDLTRLRAQSQVLRALGHALGQRHGEPWDLLLDLGRGFIRRTLGHDTTSDDILYNQTLALALEVRHGPGDARLAPPNLSRILIQMALAIEHVYVLASEDSLPAPLAFPPVTLSPREQQRSAILRCLAALQFGPQLSPGHRVTAEDLLDIAGGLREKVQQAFTGGRHRPGRVWAKAEQRLAEQTFAGDLIFGLAGCLGASLLTLEHVEDQLINDGAMALCLEQLAAGLEPPSSSAVLPSSAPAGDSAPQ